MRLKSEARKCNICGLSEPTKDKPQVDECGSHVGIHPSIWNLAENNTLWSRNSPVPQYPVTHTQYRRFYTKLRKRTQSEEKLVGQSTTEKE